MTQDECSRLGCCWAPLRPISKTRRVELPNCYTANGFDATYYLSGVHAEGTPITDPSLDWHRARNWCMS